MSLSWISPLSLYSIPVAWIIAFYPHNMRFQAITKTVGFDNVFPRGNEERLMNSPVVDQEMKDRIKRMGAAHSNGNEVLPLWIGAVLAGNMAGLSNKTLNIASAAFITLRLLYNQIYINQTSNGVGWIRTAVFFTGLGFPMYLLIAAANAVRRNSVY